MTSITSAWPASRDSRVWESSPNAGLYVPRTASMTGPYAPIYIATGCQISQTESGGGYHNIRIETGFVYLAVILNVDSRRGVEWAIGRQTDTRLTRAAWRTAVLKP